MNVEDLPPNLPLTVSNFMALHSMTYDRADTLWVVRDSECRWVCNLFYHDTEKIMLEHLMYGLRRREWAE